MQIGARCDYIIDQAAGRISIVPAKNGRFQLSRKRTGENVHPLVDLRNKEVLDAVRGAPALRVSVYDDCIQVEAEPANKRAGKQGVILEFPRRMLSELRLAAGSTEPVCTLFEGAQVAFDEQLSGSQGLDITRLHQELSDVYTVVSLFSGAGILDWPFFNDPAFCLQYAIDYDKDACQTYRYNIGTHIVHGDVHEAFTGRGDPREQSIKECDVIIGGPSCKPFSASNRHTRLEDHPDSDLVVEYMRIVNALEPKVFAIENVPAIVTASNGLYYKAITDKAKEMGYELDCRIVQDNEVGGYTTRRRVFIIGSRVGAVKFPSLKLAHGGKTVQDAFCKINASWSNLKDITLAGKETEARMSYVPQGGNYTSIPPELQTSSKNRHSCTYRRLALNEPSPTIINWRKPPLIHPTENRTLSVAEAKALHGLPGSFKILGGLSGKQQQVGNSVPVALGEYLKSAVLATLRAFSCKAAITTS